MSVFKDLLKKLGIKKDAAEKTEVKKTKKTEREKTIEYAMKVKDWSREKAIAEINKARERMGISYKNYRTMKMAEVAEDQQAAVYQNILEKRLLKAEKQREIFALVSQKNGWAIEDIEKDYKACKKAYGCTAEEYNVYNFWELPHEEKKTYYLYKHHKYLRNKWCVSNEMKQTMLNKEEANRMFSDYLNREWCINEDISREDFIKKFEGCTGVVFKPSKGSQGQGIKAYYFDEEQDQGMVYDILSKQVRGVVEEKIIQHEVLNRFNADSVNTLRVLTVSCFEKPVTADGKNIDIAYAVLKMGGSPSIVDNLHAGKGVCAAVSLETGELITNGVDWDGNASEYHPRTGVKIKGTVIPYVEEVKEFVKTIIKEKNLEGVIGWDIAIGENGPILIELNAWPSSRLANIPYAEDRIGFKPHMDRYLWDEQ